MSKLKELIDKLCPDGVEWRTIKETVGVNRGKRLTKNKLIDNGLYEVYHGSKDTPLGLYDKFNAPKETVIVVNTGGIGGVKFINDNFWCSDGSFWLGKSKDVNPKFLYHYLCGFEDYFFSKKRIGGVPTIDRSVVENLEIPLPPIEVQEEIVRILDQFSSLTAELQAELQARQMQYEYYRNKLLSFNNIGGGIEYKKLGDCSIMQRGTSLTKKNSQEGIYPVISGGKVPAFFCNQFNREGETITVAGSGAGAGYVQYWNEHIFVCDAFSVKGDKDVSTKYLYYCLNNMQDKIYATKKGGGVPHVQISSIENFLIPLPPIEEQERIVNILDKFEALVSDLSQGLPAEIEARQEQYEYYRNKLLSFPKNYRNKV